MIYLDNAATTRIDPTVAEAMHACHLFGYVNPASQHAGGRQARAALEDAHDQIVDLLGASSDDQLIFTSGRRETIHAGTRG